LNPPIFSGEYAGIIAIQTFSITPIDEYPEGEGFI